jgi:hypothetical protein
MKHKSILIIVAFVGCALIVGFAALQANAQSMAIETTLQPHQPRSVIGNGTPGSCTETAFATAFNAGGSITFNCGAAPVTITLTSRYTVTVDTLIDGGTLDQIILSGGDTGTGPRNGVGFFAVPAGRSLTLQNMALRQAGDTAIVNAGNLTLVSDRIDYARAAACGSIASIGHLTDNLSLFAYNTVDGYGGGICIQGGTAHLMNDQIVGNTAGGVGGGLYNNGGLIDTYGLYLVGNVALRGGGAYNATGSHLTLLYAAPEYNEVSLTDANGVGGGVDNHGVLTMTGNIVQYNLAYKGAGIANDGTLYLEGSEVQSNATASADPANNIGGGLLTSAPMVISNTLFALNTSGDAAIYAAAPVTLTGVTIAENTALQGTSGLAAYAPASIEFSTFYNNARSALSPRSASATIAVRGSIFDNGACEVNTGTPHVVSLGHNLSDDDGTTCGLTTSTDITNSDPLLGELIVPGWNASLRQPLSGSPAIDAGDFDCPATDPIGTTRPQGGVCDIGAIEVKVPDLQPTPIPTLNPIDIPGGVHPSIAVLPDHGYGGQTVMIIGQGAQDYPQVRIMSVQNGQSVAAVDTTVDANGSYSATLIVPAELAPGATRLCATIPGTPNAELACAAFTIDPMPGGTISGSLTITPGVFLDAQLNLLDSLGRLRYTLPVDANGQFNLNTIAPGAYRYAVTGNAPTTFPSGFISVMPGEVSHIQLPPGAEFCLPGVSKSSSLILLTRDLPGGAKQPDAASGLNVIPALNLAPWRPPVADMPNLQFDYSRFQRQQFGLYINDVPRTETFRSIPLVNGSVQSVIFRLVDANGNTLQQQIASSAPYIATFEMKGLPVSTESGTPQVWAIPVVNGQQRCPSAYNIWVIGNPANKVGVQDAPYSTIFWDTAASLYGFKIAIPKVPGILPFYYNLPWLPLFGVLENRLNLALQTEGTIAEDGTTYVRTINSIADVYVLNNQLVSPNNPLEAFAGDRTFGISTWANETFDLGLTNVTLFKAEIPQVEIPIISLFGLIDVTVVGAGSDSVGLELRGQIRPLRPQVAATIAPYRDQYREQGMGVRLLEGAASGGASLITYIKLSLPLTLQLTGTTPDASLGVCVSIYAKLRAWATVAWGLAKPSTIIDIIPPYTYCPLNAKEAVAAVAAVPDPSVPDVLAAPAVATSPDGQTLTAYVENTAAISTTPQVQILARFQNVNGQWANPIALSDPTHSAADPVVAFAGPSHLPIVAWVEKPYDATVAAQLGDDYNAHMQRQEIFYSVYSNTVWSAPIRLTNDLVPDGLPALAGSADGAVLAWTRDTDGDSHTRSDQRIAVSRFDPAMRQFGLFQLLTGGAGGLNADVRVAYDSSMTPTVPYVVWVNDADANLTTADDRHLAIASFESANWMTQTLQSLPARVDSPSISAGADGVRLTFLVRDVAADGKAGLIGVNGALWTARLFTGTWTGTPVQDEHGGTVYAEQPLLANNAGETLLLTRRFGAPDTTAALGQISLSRLSNSNQFSAPLYVTDDPHENWQQAIAINPVSRQAVILKVGRVPGAAAHRAQMGIAPLSTVAATQATAQPTAATVNSAADPVESLAVVATADPALDPLQVSATVPAIGQPVTVTATVRNVGRDVASNLTVTLYRGLPGSGTLIGVQNINGSLAMNASASLAFTLTTPGGELPLYAEVTTTGANATTTDDRVSIVLGIPSQPAIDGVAVGRFTPSALDIDYHSPSNEQPTGFRILRSTSISGTYELAGESAAERFTDTLVKHGQTYCYQVQAYSGNTLSPLSAPVCGELPLSKIYLPLVLR